MRAISRFCFLATTVGVLAAAAPAMAAPTTFCVEKQSCVDAGGTPEPDLGTALWAAGKDSGTDRIEIGPGEFHRTAGWSYDTASAQNAVHIVGAGEGQTTLIDDDMSTTTALTLSGLPSSSVSDLSIVQPTPQIQPNEGIGLDLTGTARHVDVQGHTCFGPPVRLETGASLEESHVSLNPSCPAVESFGGPVRIAGSVIEQTSGKGIGLQHWGPGTLNVTRTRISAGTAVYASGSGTLNIDNSLLLGHQAGVHSLAEKGTLAVHLGHDTIVGGGQPGSEGIKVVGAVKGAAATLHLENSIVANYEQSVVTDVVPGAGAGANVRYSDLTGIVVNGGGTIDTVDHVQKGDPRFVDPATTDYRLRADSPFVDAGTTDINVQPSGQDLAGAQRAVAAPDVGAFEFQPHAPVAQIAGPDTAVVGQPVSFTSAGSSDPDPGDALTMQWAIEGGAAGGPDVTHSFQQPGKATVELAVKDLQGQTSTVSKVVDVQAAPVADVAPIVSAFSITKRRVGLKARKRAAFRFNLSEDARVRISFARVGRKGRAASKAGALAMSAHAGANRIAFSGRLGRQTLKAGRYRATIVATDPGGHRSAPRSLAFRVVSR